VGYQFFPLFTIPPSKRTIQAVRILLPVIAAGLLLVESGAMTKPVAAVRVVSSTASAVSVPKVHVDFDTQLKPIFKSKCMPCHFSGGQMYDRLPFDRPETIRKLGVKLFTRIKEENDRQLIEAFLTHER
jgi:hypothetical protein